MGKNDAIKFMNISKRQSAILSFIGNNPGAQTQDIRAYVSKKNESEISRITIIRDLEVLLENNLLKKKAWDDRLSTKFLSKEACWLRNWILMNILKSLPISAARQKKLFSRIFLKA